MSFIYPRTVSAYRYDVEGDMEYEGNNYSVITAAQNLAASIQLAGITMRPNTDLPSDASNETYYNIFIPKLIPRDTIKTRDQIVDDSGLRYEVVGPYWNSLGYKLRCKLLQP